MGFESSTNQAINVLIKRKTDLDWIFTALWGWLVSTFNPLARVQFEENSVEITADPFVKALFQLVHPIELNERLSRLDPSLHVSLLSISYRQNR